jgi:hypothetical protein
MKPGSLSRIMDDDLDADHGACWLPVVSERLHRGFRRSVEWAVRTLITER